MARFPGATWDTRTPAEAGMSQANLDSLATAVGGRGFVVRDGYKVYSWGSETLKEDWASAAKPVTATMLLFALQESLITSVNELVKDHGWTMSSKDQTMTLLHLTNMISGYGFVDTPGAKWAYNDYAVQLFHETLFDNIFAGTPNTIATDSSRLGKLQFQDGSIYSSRGGYGVSTSVRDMARIGWFWLNKGYWKDEQVLPRAWFDTYQQPLVAGNIPRTSDASPSDYLTVGTYGGGFDQSAFGPGVYGFGWWFNGLVAQTVNRAWPDAPTDLFVAQGHFGTETLLMIPSLGLVIASDGDWGDFDLGNAAASMNSRFQAAAATVTGDAPGGAGTKRYKLQYKRTADPDWTDVPTSV